jgi:hypothetical protein
MRFILLLFTVLLVCISCTPKKKEWLPGSEPNNAVYSSVEMYCLCFYDSTDVVNADGTITTSDGSCETLVRVDPSAMIKEDLLFDSTSNRNVITAIQRVIFNRIRSAEKLKGVNNSKFEGVDSRFVILFKGKDGGSDVFVVSSSRQYIYNGKYKLDYSFNVMDSIKSILHINKIKCI